MLSRTSKSASGLLSDGEVDYNSDMGARPKIRASRSRIDVAWAAALLCCVSVCLSAPPAGAEDPSAELSRLRLWSALPTRHFVQLGGESLPRSRWEAFAFRSPRSADPGRVCLSIVSARLVQGVLSYSFANPQCGPVGKSIDAPILYASGSTGRARSALVVVTGTEAIKVSASTHLGNSLEAPFRTVQGRRARKGRLAPFRYALLVSHEQGPIRQVTGVGRGGAVEFETPG